MARITPGNHLYFYQLFSTELGIGKQTLIPRVEEVLAAAEVDLADVECETVDDLLAALSDFMKVTVFKKGRVYATVMARDDLDELLRRAEEPIVDKDAVAAGKSWKRRKNSKDVRPTKPRPKRVRRQSVPTETPAASEAAAAEPAIGVADASPEATPEAIETPAADEAPTTRALPMEEPAPEVRETDAEEEPAPEVREAPTEEGLATTEVPEATEQTVEEALSVEPSITLDIVYTPETPVEEAEDEEEAAPEEVEAEAETPEVAPRRVRLTPRKPLRTPRLPQTFSEDVFLPSELLLKLYQALPPKKGILDTLDESWEFAQEVGTSHGSRTRITFPLSRSFEGQWPVEVTIERGARLPSGKFWKLVEVDDGTDEADEA